MPNLFQALTLSYKNAPIAIREMVALNEQASRSLLEKIKEFTPAREVLVLSTCNRTEVYYAADEDLSRQIIKLIALEKASMPSATWSLISSAWRARNGPSPIYSGWPWAWSPR